MRTQEVTKNCLRKFKRDERHRRKEIRTKSEEIFIGNLDPMHVANPRESKG